MPLNTAWLAQADDATWQALAMHYLRALSSALQLSAGQRRWLSPAVWRRLEDSAAGRSVPPGLAWLPITWGRLDEVDDDPTGSFWLARPGAGPSGDGSRDGTLVLLAGCMQLAPRHERPAAPVAASFPGWSSAGQQSANFAKGGCNEPDHPGHVVVLVEVLKCSD